MANKSNSAPSFEKKDATNEKLTILVGYGGM